MTEAIMQTDAVIHTHDLSKRFRSKQAVDHLNLSVPRGSIFALLGDNGAGKTTTIRMLTGLLPPDAGKATVLGRDAWNDASALRRLVGYMPERPRFYDWMTVSEIGWFAAGFHGPDFRTSFVYLAAKFQLDPSARLKNLSKGEYAKVGLALALAPGPELLILDEPTSGLDLLVRREFLSRMINLAGEGRTILISSHQIAEVERVASHVAFMSHGKVLLTATMEELRQRIVRLRLRYESQPPDPAQLGTVLQRNGTGRLWQAVIKDPNRLAVDSLRGAAGISDFEEVPLGLEEIYCALLERKEAAS
jgi:ABC-2 type transport system ATP-binding protein